VLRIAGSQEMVVHATAKDLWRMVADVTRTREWSPDVLRSEWIPPSTGPEVGARFRSVNRLPLAMRWSSTSTVTEAVPGRRFAFVVGSDPRDPNTTWIWDFESASDGARVRLSYQMHREPWIVLVYYRLTGRAKLVRRSVGITLERLKNAAEASSLTG
jgi:hypothetical protein